MQTVPLATVYKRYEVSLLIDVWDFLIEVKDTETGNIKNMEVEVFNECIKPLINELIQQENWEETLNDPDIYKGGESV